MISVRDRVAALWFDYHTRTFEKDIPWTNDYYEIVYPIFPDLVSVIKKIIIKEG